MASQFIIYGLVDPRTGQIRYIGQSSRGTKRSYAHRWTSRDRNTHKSRWIDSLKRQGLNFSVTILQEFSDGASLDEAEISWIAKARSLGWKITNIATGGSAPWLGKKHSPSTIEKMRAAKLGKKNSPEHCRHMSIAASGKSPSKETRKKMSLARSGRGNSPEVRKKISASLSGKPRPYMAERNRSLQWTVEMRAKISAARKLNTANPPKALKIEHGGKTHSIAEWSRRTGIPYRRLRDRLMKLRWTPEKALSI